LENGKLLMMPISGKLVGLFLNDFDQIWEGFAPL
jgi:hypothetical protein